MSRNERSKVVRGHRLACHRTLVDMILNVLAIGVFQSETESSPTLSRPKPSESDSVASNSALSRDHVRFVSVETESGQSLLRASWHSTLMTKHELYQIGVVAGDTKPEQMENNDRTLKELATLDMVRRSPQELKRIPCGLFHNEVAGDTRGLHQNEEVSIFLGWMAVSTASSLQHLGRHEMNVPGEVLFGIQDNDHQEGNLWDKATLWRDFA
ncbi:hypothetical protein CR513_25032, partial [Mucuna pruriens]